MDMSNKPCWSPFEKQPVSIVGIAAELPGGPHAEHDLDYRQFIEFLLNKGEAFEEAQKERIDVESWSKDVPSSHASSTHGSYLKNPNSFDHAEFGVSVDYARGMATSTKKLLEVSFLSLHDAGIDYRGRNVGWYASGCAHDVLSIAEMDDQEAKGAFASIPCNADEISRLLDLRGPCVPIDTTCNSSLTALHLAVQAVRVGECEAAVVAGCQLNPRPTESASAGSTLFEDGLPKGEGIVAVVLKRFDDAKRDGDHIYANILGTGINASGAVTPSEERGSDMRVDAMWRAYQGIDCDPKDVDYVEVHATGLTTGDPAESKWVGQAFAQDSGVLVGSLTGNMGRLGNAAFLASLCKVCSILETGVVPPTLIPAQKNSAALWDNTKLRVPKEPTAITSRSASGKLTISMSSSGIGGTNGHVVIQSVLPQSSVQMDVQESVRPVLLVAGGLTPRSSNANAASLACMAASKPDDNVTLSTIYGRRARQMTWRTFAVTNPGQQGSLKFPPPVLSPRVKQPIVFVFPGQGPQHINMGRQLFKRFTVFRDTILELDQCHRDVTGTSLIEQIGLFEDVKPLEALPTVWPVSVIFPSMTMIQIALFDLLCSLGIRPDVLIGHSVGETPLLYASGAGSKAMAMEIAIAQGRAIAAVEQLEGTMAALACSPAEARSIIHLVCRGDDNGVLDIASFNTPDAVAISGHSYLVDKAVEEAGSRGIFARRLQTSVAVHSSLMDVSQSEYLALIKDVFGRYPGDHTPRCTTYSTATGTLFDSFTPDYFWRNFRDPVQFTQAFGAILHAYPNASVVEVSPHPVLSSYMQDMGAPLSSVVCPMRRTKEPGAYQEENDLLSCLGQLIVAGHDSVDFHALNSQDSVSNTLSLPPYPFVNDLMMSMPPSPPPEHAPDSVREVVIQSLNVEPASFSPDAPLTTYGLDSLSAGRLAFALRPFVTISAMQLLKDVSLTDLERRSEAEKCNGDGSSKVAPSVTYFQWDGVHKPGQTVLKLVDNGDTPLIVIHGASGSPLPFLAIQEKFTTSLWALQTTPETPLHSLKAFCNHYYEQIKIAQPHGPYRLGAFCASTIMAVMIAQMLEANGDKVAQLVFIDHFPLLWVSPLTKPDEEAMRLRTAGPSAINRLLASMLTLYRADPSPTRHRAAQDWQNAADGLEAPAHVQDWWNTFKNLHIGIYEFLFELLPPGVPPSTQALQEALLSWLRLTRAPMTIYVAMKGYLAFIPEDERAGWEQYGIERVAPDAKVITVTGGHFQVLESPEFIESVQTDWSC